METVGFLIAVGSLSLLWAVEHFRRQHQRAMNLLQSTLNLTNIHLKLVTTNLDLILNAQERQLLELRRQNRLSEDQVTLLTEQQRLLQMILNEQSRSQQ